MKTILALYNKGKTVQFQAGLPSILASYKIIDFVITLPNITEKEEVINNSTSRKLM